MSVTLCEIFAHFLWTESMSVSNLGFTATVLLRCKVETKARQKMLILGGCMNVRYFAYRSFLRRNYVQAAPSDNL